MPYFEAWPNGDIGIDISSSDEACVMRLASACYNEFPSYAHRCRHRLAGWRALAEAARRSARANRRRSILTSACRIAECDASTEAASDRPMAAACPIVKYLTRALFTRGGGDFDFRLIEAG